MLVSALRAIAFYRWVAYRHRFYRRLSSIFFSAIIVLLSSTISAHYRRLSLKKNRAFGACFPLPCVSRASPDYGTNSACTKHQYLFCVFISVFYRAFSNLHECIPILLTRTFSHVQYRLSLHLHPKHSPQRSLFVHPVPVLAILGLLGDCNQAAIVFFDDASSASNPSEIDRFVESCTMLQK